VTATVSRGNPTGEDGPARDDHARAAATASVLTLQLVGLGGGALWLVAFEEAGQAGDHRGGRHPAGAGQTHDQRNALP